jgi:hypothetical protein
MAFVFAARDSQTGADPPRHPFTPEILTHPACRGCRVSESLCWPDDVPALPA